MDDLCIALRGRSEVLKRRRAGKILFSINGLLMTLEAIMFVKESKACPLLIDRDCYLGAFI